MKCRVKKSKDLLKNFVSLPLYGIYLSQDIYWFYYTEQVDLWHVFLALRISEGLKFEVKIHIS